MNHRTHPHAQIAGAYAGELVEAVAAAPEAPILAGVQGAGGFGKSALLDQLAGIYREAGVPVSGPKAPKPGSAVLVDDAHALSAREIVALRERASSMDTRLVLAYRPWPRSQELADLIAMVTRHGTAVSLAAMSVQDLSARVPGVIGTFSGVNPAHEWVSWLRTHTGGVPRFADRVLSAMSPDDVGSFELPRGALDRFHHEVDQLGPAERACLAALALGGAPHPGLLAEILDLDEATARDAVSALRAGGLLGADDLPLPIAREVVGLLTPWERRLDVTKRLIVIQARRGGPMLPLIRPLLDTSAAADPDLVPAFRAAAEEATFGSPKLAMRILDAAVSAGVRPGDVAASKARAAAAAGELDEALRLADQVIVDEQASNRALGVQVAASVLAHRGLLERSAELCGWSARHVRWPGDMGFAVTGLIGVGRLSQAQELLRPSDTSSPPTSLLGATTRLADGVRESVTGSAGTALSTLVNAVSLFESVDRSALVPETPAAIAAIVAFHCGEFDVANSTLDRVIESRTGGPLSQVRHRLLAAWQPLVRGDTVTARNQLRALEIGTTARDRLLATAIEAGIANRDNDMAALTAVRGRIRTVVAEHPIDLFSLLALGELLFAAARLRDQEWLEPYLNDATALLERLGNPPLWTSLLTWKCLQAAIVLDDDEAAGRRARELESMAGHNPMSAAMADAARCWIRIMAAEVDVEEALRAARGLHAAGLTWDGARLAGQAAIRTTDRAAMPLLLECARALQGKGPRPRAVGNPEGSGDLLSGREKEVAELVVSGLTYKQVGKRLFISAKTVEHHISRIRQRLGCSTREELLTRLRELLESPGERSAR